jgi:FHA domain
MSISEFLEKWGRALFEAPLAAVPKPAEPPELAEIRLAVLDQVHERSYRSGGRKVFPFDDLRVDLRGVEEDRAPALQTKFFQQYLEQEVCGALRNAGCRFPATLRVTVRVTAGLPKPDEPWLRVEAGQQQGSDSAAPEPAKLVVRTGTANVAELRLDKTRTNIGRSSEVVRSGGIFRRNDLAFGEETEIDRSVSREHAHIICDRSVGEYRLFTDRWYTLGTQGSSTWVVRDGMSQEVHRNGRGARLEFGDEIHFGEAVVVFERS